MSLKYERGAAAILIAGSLLMLMGIAAIAIDGGLAFSERRQAQTGVDFAALAALQAATSCAGGTCDTVVAANNGASEAEAVVAENLPGRVLGWGACTDPSRPLKFTRVATSTPCVSYTSNFDEARVVLPADIIDTQFAGVIGQNTLQIGALAEAGQDNEATSAVVPFAFSGGTQTCLFSNQAPQTIDPCDGPTTGNFGYLDITQYGNDALGTSADCSNAALGRLVENIALGVDHLLAVWISPDPLVPDRPACPNTSETPNQLEVQPGVPTLQLTNGLVRSTSPTARLRCTSGCRTVRGAALNNTPLWSFLTGTCTAGNKAEMTTCLDTWTPGDGVIFSASIANNPRFAAVPSFSSPLVGFGLHAITDFVPVYLDTIYANCNANSCDTVFTPGSSGSVVACPNPLTAADENCGFTGTWGGGDRVEGLTAFTIQRGMLPDSVLENFPGSPGLRIYNLTE